MLKSNSCAGILYSFWQVVKQFTTWLAPNVHYYCCIVLWCYLLNKPIYRIGMRQAIFTRNKALLQYRVLTCLFDTLFI
jgi:hypothetical protein